MGKIEGWEQPPGTGVLPNGLLPDASPLIQVLDSERWLEAEQRTTELITTIQPNSPSEERRNAVADYVQRLIMKCFPCQVFTFGSVPLKTYLPDGDIDLTAFSNSQNLKDTWANLVRDMLESEEKNENAEFRVKEVQYIQAEVKLIKCLVENIVVDISFNQLGGLCTLCFLEEVDHMIGQNHLFKRSVILIKAWCYYESRVLGAHHGLISTYALETLVLYIFHVFNNSFTGPLEVLYRFLEFFSNFDWDNFCVSLWGPVPITSLPDVTAEHPRKDCGELLLSKLFLNACSSVYAVFPGGQENQGHQFVSKHFNVIDPLRLNNNLGRSVSKGNFFRIRSAFAFGAKRLAKLLDCPKENLLNEVNQFFANSWNRHESGSRPDALYADILCSRLSTPGYSHGYESLKNGSSAKLVNGNISGCDTEAGKTRPHKFSSQPGNYSLENMPTGTERIITQSKKVYGSLKNSRAFDQAVRDSCTKVHLVKGQRTVRPDFLVNDVPGRFLFARTRSSPDLTGKGRRNKAPEGGKNQITRPENNNKKGQESENINNYGRPSSVSDHSPIGHLPSLQNLDAVESNSSLRMEEEKQDLVNMMASTTLHSLHGQIHMPMNLASGHLPFPVSPLVLASMGYSHRNFCGMVPPNIQYVDPSLSHMQFPQGLVPPPLTQYFPGYKLNSSAVDMIERNNENLVSVEMNHDKGDLDLWQDQDVVSPGGSIPDNRNYEMVQTDDKLQQSSLSHEFVPSSRNQQKFTKENQAPMRDVNLYHENESNYTDDKIAVSRLSSAGRSSSLRSRTSSESSWDGSPSKFSRTIKEKRGKKKAPTDPSSYDKVKNVTEHTVRPVENGEVWDMRSTMGNEASSVGSLHITMAHIHGYNLAQTSGSDPMMPMGPMLLGHGSQQRVMDNSGAVFYPTGPPVPFLTMLPFYNVPPENSETSRSHFGGGQGLDNSNSHQIEELNTYSPRRATSADSSNDEKPDILNSDFASHWQNLLFGRFCQNPHSHGGYPSPMVVPPMYLQGRVPFDGPGRPDMNIFTQLTGFGPRFIPVGPFQSASNRPPTVYQHYVEIPRQRSGTGTYLPNLKLSPKDRNSSGPRRGNYDYERKDNHGDGERNWNSTKLRPSGRNHNRGQNEKSNSRVDRLNSNENHADQPWNSSRRDSFSYQAQNNHLHSNSSQSATPPSMAYNMYAMQAMNPNGVSSNEPSVPSSVMLYPLGSNANFENHTEQLEFGSLGFSSLNDQRQLNEGSRSRGAFDEQRYHGVSTQRSSPDQPLSPHFQRGI